MPRTKPQRPIPFAPTTEMGAGITTQQKRPQLRAHWYKVNGQLACQWRAE